MLGVLRPCSVNRPGRPGRRSQRFVQQMNHLRRTRHGQSEFEIFHARFDPLIFGFEWLATAPLRKHPQTIPIAADPERLGERLPADVRVAVPQLPKERERRSKVASLGELERSEQLGLLE